MSWHDDDDDETSNVALIKFSKSKHLLPCCHACMMESTTQKNKSKKSSLLMRLKPVMGFDDSIMPNRNGDDPVLSYLAIANKNGAVLPAMLSSMFGGAEDLGEKCGCRRRKWQALRAVFSGTTLVLFFSFFRFYTTSVMDELFVLSHLMFSKLSPKKETRGKTKNSTCH